MLRPRPLFFQTDIYIDMSRRNKVFQSKVLQKLYSAAPKLEKEPSPPRFSEAQAKKVHVKRKACQEDIATGDARKEHSAAAPGRRMYTVLPPPAEYQTHSEKSVTLPQLESVNIAEDPAGESIHDCNKELDQDKEEYKMRRRNRKRKSALHQDSGKDGSAPPSESCPSPMAEGVEHISKNKKRKLKKKRHKEKLLSMGLMPRATALEFTYKREVEEKEESDETKAAEVSDFLRTTLDICMSDSSLHVDKRSLLSGTLDDLLSSISSGRKPTSVLKELYSLKALVQQKETHKLENALRELYKTSSMSAEETSAVVSLFQYWITDILPLQEEKKTKVSTTHPRETQSQ